MSFCSCVVMMAEMNRESDSLDRVLPPSVGRSLKHGITGAHSSPPTCNSPGNTFSNPTMSSLPTESVANQTLDTPDATRISTKSLDAFSDVATRSCINIDKPYSGDATESDLASFPSVQSSTVSSPAYVSSSSESYPRKLSVPKFDLSTISISATIASVQRKSSASMREKVSAKSNSTPPRKRQKRKSSWASRTEQYFFPWTTATVVVGSLLFILYFCSCVCVCVNWHTLFRYVLVHFHSCNAVFSPSCEFVLRVCWAEHSGRLIYSHFCFLVLIRLIFLSHSCMCFVFIFGVYMIAMKICCIFLLVEYEGEFSESCLFLFFEKKRKRRNQEIRVEGNARGNFVPNASTDIFCWERLENQGGKYHTYRSTECGKTEMYSIHFWMSRQI